jgi:AraC-like DNA-binding protein
MAEISTKIPSYKIQELKNLSKEKKDFEFYRFEYFVSNIDHLKHPHRHDHFALFFVTGGDGHHVIDFKDYQLKANRIFLMAPGQIHAWKSLIGVKGFVLLFTKDFFSLTLQYRELRTHLFFNLIYQQAFLDLNKADAESLREVLKRIEEEYVGNQSYGQNIIRSYINILLFRLKRAYEISLPKMKEQNILDVKLREFEVLVNRHFKTMHSVAAYAGILHITPNYLNAVCTKRKGKPAGEIIRERVMLEAKRLLTHSEGTIGQIAYELNFEDNSYFGRFFKKYAGQTPAEFRNESKKETLNTGWLPPKTSLSGKVKKKAPKC